MGFLGLGIALMAIVSALLPMPGMFVGMGLAIFAVGLGTVGYRRRQDTGWARLAGAAAIAMATVALLISGTRYALTLWAIDRIDSLL